MTLDEFEEYLTTCIKNYIELRDKAREMVLLACKFDSTGSVEKVSSDYRKSAEIYDFIVKCYQDALTQFKKTKD